MSGHDEYCRPTEDLLSDSFGFGLTRAVVLSVPFMVVLKVFGVTWGTTFLIGFFTALIIFIVVAAIDFYDYVDTRAYYQRKYHSQPPTTLTPIPFTQARSVAQFTNTMVSMQVQNRIESMPTVKVAVGQARAYIRTSADEARWRSLSDALVEEVLGIVNNVNQMRSTPLVRDACQRYLARMQYTTNPPRTRNC